MSHEILSIKMYELDRRIGRLHSLIQMSETASRDWIHAEVGALQRQCAEAELSLRNQLRYSKSSMVARLSEAYSQIEQAIQTAVAQMKNARDQQGADISVEEKLLVAEYALDFAAQAADHALLTAMDAIDACLAQQEAEETKP